MELLATFFFNEFTEQDTRRQSLEQATHALQKSRRLVIDELRIMEPLLAGGDIGQAELIRLRRQEAELNGQIVNLRNKFFQDA